MPPDQGADNDALTSAALFVSPAAATVGSAALSQCSNPGSNDVFRMARRSSATRWPSAAGEASAALGIGGDESNNQTRDAGAVYVFVRQGTSWTQQAYIKASNTGTNDNFGRAVALAGEGSWFSSESSGDLLAVGAYAEGSRATGIDGDQADNSAPFAGAVTVPPARTTGHRTRNPSQQRERPLVRTSVPYPGYSRGGRGWAVERGSQCDPPTI